MMTSKSTTSEVRLDNFDKLSHGQTRTFEIEHNGEVIHGFVLAHQGEYFVYRNRCPHWGVDLDMGDGRFYAEKVDRIYCKNHGALFDPRSGYCVAGPCQGCSLESFNLRIEGTVMWVGWNDRVQGD